MPFPEGVLKIEEDHINASLELFLVVRQVGYELNVFCDTIYTRPEAFPHAGVEEVIIHKVTPNFIPEVSVENILDPFEPDPFELVWYANVSVVTDLTRSMKEPDYPFEVDVSRTRHENIHRLISECY